MREYLEKRAPMNNIDKIKKPMFVMAGKNDPRIPESESQQIADALKKQGTPVWLLIAKDEGHGDRKKGNQDFQFCATVEFLQQYLLKEEEEFTTEGKGDAEEENSPASLRRRRISGLMQRCCPV